MSNTSLYGSAITEVVPVSSNTSPYSTTAIGVVSDTNTTSLYTNTNSFTTGTVVSAVSSVTAGAGINVNPNTGNVVVTNTGVTSLTAGAGIALNASTGAITITNTGIGTTYNIDASTVSGGANLNLTGSDATTDSVKFASGSGITVSRTDANTITISAPTSGVTSITGTANQIIASSSTGAVTLSTPQNIGTTSNVNFNNITAAGNLSNNYFTLPNNTGTTGQVLTSNGSSNPTWTTVNSGVTSVTGSGHITASPTTGAVVIGSDATSANTASTIVARDSTGAFSSGSITIADNKVIYASHGTYGPPDNTFTNVRIGLYGTDPNYSIGIENNHSWIQGNNGVKLYSGDNVPRLIANTSGVRINNAYTLPTTDGTSNQVIKTDGSGNLSWVNGSVTIGTTNLALGATALTLGGLTTVTVTQDPVANLDLATKQYVDQIATTGLAFHDPVYVATVVNVTAVAYNQPGGPGVGVGATLTRTSSFATLQIDGVVVPLGARVLVRLQTTQQWNGVYTVTNTGSPTTGWVLTRATDADTYGNTPGTLSLNDYFFVQNGTTQKGIAYVLNAPAGPIIFGTSAITFAEFSNSQVYTGTSPIDVTGTVISLTTVPINLGGTGQTTANDALNALLPTQTANAGKLLTTNGTNTSWTALSSIGVTSITGTTDQIIASSSTGAVTLSTPQDIATTSSPTFNNLTTTGDIAVNGGDITTTGTTFNLVNTTATTVNLGGAATTIGIGATTGTATINNTTVFLPNANLNFANRGFIKTSSITTTSTSPAVLYTAVATGQHNVKFQLDVFSGTSRQTADITITEDETTSYITVANEMWTSTILSDFSTDITGGNVRLLVTPTSAASMTFRIMYSALN